MFKTILSDKINSVSLWGSSFFFLITILVVIISYSHLPPFLPLYNKLPWGYARLGNNYEILIPIITMIIIGAVNIFLGQNIYKRNPLLSRFLFLVVFLSSLFTCIFIVKLTLTIL